MGVVVAARHVQLGSLFALKFMRADVVRVEGAADRFNREARAAARLRGEHVARVTDFGTLDNGSPYIVMEFLEGADLDAVVDARGPLPINEALNYVLDACKAMEEAHNAGIVHRDLKPKNMFLTQRPDGTPVVKVLDFGISKFADGTDVNHTSTGSILGSPAFMSPEQIRSSKHVDPRTDIYALGGVIYYLLSKDYPFSAPAIGELFASVLYKEPRPLRSLRGDVPPALEAIIGRCLQKEPDARYQSVGDLMRALRSYLDWDHSGETELYVPAYPVQPAQPAPPVASFVSEARTSEVAVARVPAYGPPPQAFPMVHERPSQLPQTHSSGVMQSTLDHAALEARRGASSKAKTWPMLALCALSIAIICAAGVRFYRMRHAEPALVQPVEIASPSPGAPAASDSASLRPILPEEPAPSTSASAPVPAAASASGEAAKPPVRPSGARSPRSTAYTHGDAAAGASASQAPTAPSPLRHGALYDDGHSPTTH